MKSIRILTLALVALFGLTWTLPAQAGVKEESLRKIVSDYSPHVVTINAVIKTQFGSRQGREQKLNLPGFLLGPSGVVVCFSAPFTSQSRGKMTIKRIPLSLKIVEGSNPTEHDAFLGATDSRFGLAFLQIKHPEKLALKNEAGFENLGKPEVGQQVVAVTRFGKALDYAPAFNLYRLNSLITKPRKMWSITDIVIPGLPVFTTDGKMLGVVGLVDIDRDSGSQSLGRGMGGGSAQVGVCLLPIKIFKLLLKSSKKKIAKLRKKIAEQDGKKKEEAKKEDTKKEETKKDEKKDETKKEPAKKD